MNCRESLKQIAACSSASLQKILNGNATTGLDTALHRHLSACPACIRRLELEQQFRTLIKQRAPRFQAPADLLDKVLDQAAIKGLSDAPYPPISDVGQRGSNQRIHPATNLISSLRTFFASPVRRLGYSLAALFVFGLIALFCVMLWRGGQPGVFDVVEANVPYTPSAEQKQVDWSDLTAAEAWFRGQLGFAIRIPEFNTARLLGGSRCSLFDQPVALLFYQQAGKDVCLFILADLPQNLDTVSWLEYRGKPIGVASSKGYHVVLWEENQLAYLLASDLPIEALLDLVSQL